MDTQTEPKIVDAEAIEIKSLSLVDATLQTAKMSFALLVKDTNIDKKSKELKSQLKKIEISGTEDKENYNKVKAISKDASKVRIAVEKRRKELKSDIILAGKQIDSLANEYQALINPIENDADAKLKVVDDAIREAEEIEVQEAKTKLDNRVVELQANGIVFTGQWYGINNIAVSIQTIQEISDDDYNELLSKVKIQNEANIAAKAIADKAEADEKQRQADIKLQNEKDKAELESGRLELRGGQLELLGIGLTTEYELLIKTANNDEWKARYEELKIQKIQDIRRNELLPYITYIRDYKVLLSSDEETYQKEFAGIKQAKIDQEEYNKKEAQKEFDRQENERKEKELKDKADAETIANNAKPYELIGWKYDYGKEVWSFSVEPSRVLFISKKHMLTISESASEFNKQETEKIIKDKEEKDAKEAVEKLAEINRKELEAEEKRKSLLNDQQLFSEYISALSAIEPPLLTDATLVSKVNQIVKLINAE